MKRIRMSALALLLLPTATFASEVVVDWTGHITSYTATSGSGFPSALSTDAISGTLTYDTSLLPAPDASGIVSLTAGDFVRSTVLWAAGTFQPDTIGGTGLDSVTIDPTATEFIVTDTMGLLGPTAHDTTLSFDLMGLPGLLQTGLGIGSTSGDASMFSGGGTLIDLTFPSSGSQSMNATYVVDTLSAASVPEPGTLALLATALLCLGGMELRRHARVRGRAA